MLVTDLIHSEIPQHNEKVANIMILSPTSEISHHHNVTNKTMSPTSLSPSSGEIVKILHLIFGTGLPAGNVIV